MDNIFPFLQTMHIYSNFFLCSAIMSKSILYIIESTKNNKLCSVIFIPISLGFSKHSNSQFLYTYIIDVNYIEKHVVFEKIISFI